MSVSERMRLKGLVADALRQINHLNVSTELPDEQLQRLLSQLDEALVGLADHPPRGRGVGVCDDDSERGSHYNYGDDMGSYTPVGGRCNALAPPMSYLSRERGVLAEVTFGPAYEGPPGFVHGGYVAACLDELFGHAQNTTGEPAMTGTLITRYRRPVPLQQRLEFSAWPDRREGRKLFLKAEVRCEEHLLVESEAIFIIVEAADYAGFANERERQVNNDKGN